MHITLEVDDAIRMVDCINRSGKRTCAKKIAQKTGVSVRFALKILRKLCSAQIIRSFKGVDGGYELNRKPEELNLLDIMEAVDGNVSFSRCLDDNICQKGQNTVKCKFHSIYARLSDSIREELASVTFDEISKLDETSSTANTSEEDRCK
jgi:Rrf2 family protein